MKEATGVSRSVGNTFRWELQEMGYSQKFVEAATEGMIVYITRK